MFILEENKMTEIQYQRILKVRKEYDVLVAGAGPAGICAAVAAALCAKKNCDTRNLQISELQETLCRKGIDLFSA